MRYFKYFSASLFLISSTSASANSVLRSEVFVFLFLFSWRRPNFLFSNFVHINTLPGLAGWSLPIANPRFASVGSYKSGLRLTTCPENFWEDYKVFQSWKTGWLTSLPLRCATLGDTSPAVSEDDMCEGTSRIQYNVPSWFSGFPGSLNLFCKIVPWKNSVQSQDKPWKHSLLGGDFYLALY